MSGIPSWEWLLWLAAMLVIVGLTAIGMRLIGRLIESQRDTDQQLSDHFADE